VSGPRVVPLVLMSPCVCRRAKRGDGAALARDVWAGPTGPTQRRASSSASSGRHGCCSLSWSAGAWPVRSRAAGHDPQPAREPYLLGLSAAPGSARCWQSRAAQPDRGRAAGRISRALAAVALVYRSACGGRRLDPRVLLLSGVVVGAFAGALIARSSSSPTPPRPGTRFSGCGASARPPGSVGGVRHLRRAAAWADRAQRPRLDLIALGEEPAHHLGAEVDAPAGCVSLYGAPHRGSVAACGIIGFVGWWCPTRSG